jgi:hypothetical protein
VKWRGKFACLKVRNYMNIIPNLTDHQF